MSTEVLSRSTDPETSQIAGVKVAKSLSKVQKIVLSFVKAAGSMGMTDSEIDDYYDAYQVRMNWPKVRHETPRRRRSELRKAGLVEDSGVRRFNQYGGLEVVWVLTGTVA